MGISIPNRSVAASLNKGNCPNSSGRYVIPCRPLRAEVDYPDDLCPAANRLTDRKQHFQIKARPDRKALVREDADAAEADVPGAAPVMQQRRPRRPTKDVGL